jgi:NAD-dependent deacetylase
LVAGAKPNPAHLALAEMENLFPHFELITQNVDGLHQRAGSTRVVELHGNISRTKCFDEGAIVSSWEDTGDVPPKCPNCGGLLRPDVVWFEEPLPETEMARATAASTACDVFFSIGTSTVVYPAAALPFEALRTGATVVEINPQPTRLTLLAQFNLSDAAGVALPALLKALKASRKS